MPQVFGSEEISLMSVASLWVEADYLDDISAHEGALANAGFDSDTLPVNLDRSSLHPRGQVWGQHLMSDNTHHRYAVVRVANPDTNPNEKETGIGGSLPRYSVDIHAVPRNSSKSKGSVTPVWHGNDIRKFINGTHRSSGAIGMTWPEMQRAMQKGPRK